MSRVLIIVESPAKAKTIGKFLGKGYVVKSSMGHVRDLPKSQFGVDVEHGFEPKYITIRGKGELIKELRQAAGKTSKVLLAPDPDREGEAIAWHLQHLLRLNPEDPCRIEFNEITKPAVLQALKKPRPIDFDRVDAQQARRLLDRLVGYNLSPLLWRKIRKGLSAGRVQSVAVRLICDREEEIASFVQEEYWSLTAVLNPAAEKKLFEAKLVKKARKNIKISKREQMEAVLQELKDASYQVVDVRKKERKRNPAPPFTTSSLQQEAYRKINFTARKTMMVAQQLYEGIELGKQEGRVGLITYLRTDSTRVAEAAQQEAREYITGRFGKDYVPKQAPQYTKGKQSQDAHEAIRPTSIFREPEVLKEVLSRDQLKLYKLIWERFLASQMRPAVVDTTTVDIQAGEFLFRATGAVIKFPGFMQVYTEGKDEKGEEGEKFLPLLAQGMVLGLHRLVPDQHFTQPPPRYSEATLVKILEEKGIGRPSTYAPIIETIISRGYVVREQKQFFPTELGIIIIDLLKEHFPSIIKIAFTANLEEKLDQIEDGKLPWREVISDFYFPFLELLNEADQKIGTIELAEEVSEEKCEKCGRNLVVKVGRYGKFLACPGFPECRTTKPLLEETGVACSLCGGKVVLRRTRKGRKFYGCSNYPECEFVSWYKPTNVACPRCGHFLVEKTSKKQGKRLVCSVSGCKYEETPDEPAGAVAPRQKDFLKGYSIGETNG